MIFLRQAAVAADASEPPAALGFPLEPKKYGVGGIPDRLANKQAALRIFGNPHLAGQFHDEQPVRTHALQGARHQVVRRFFSVRLVPGDVLPDREGGIQEDQIEDFGHRRLAKGVGLEHARLPRAAGLLDPTPEGRRSGWIALDEQNLGRTAREGFQPQPPHPGTEVQHARTLEIRLQHTEEARSEAPPHRARSAGLR